MITTKTRLANTVLVAPHVGRFMLLQSPSILLYLPAEHLMGEANGGHIFIMDVTVVSI